MAEYEYAGPHPVEDEHGTLVHPGDRREMSEPPPWGPWNPVPAVSGELPGPVPRGEPGDPGPYVDLGAIRGAVRQQPAAAPPAAPEGT